MKLHYTMEHVNTSHNVINQINIVNYEVGIKQSYLFR